MKACLLVLGMSPLLNGGFPWRRCLYSSQKASHIPPSKLAILVRRLATGRSRSRASTYPCLSSSPVYLLSRLGMIGVTCIICNI